MTQIDDHPPGAFCWVEPATTDQNVAKTFSGSLVGRQVTDMSMLRPAGR